MFNFKRYLFDFLKTTFILLSVFLFGGSLYFVFALNFPNQVPSGESPGGIYTDYFNKIFQDCGNGNVLQGYDSSKNKVCVGILSGIPVPVNGSCGSGRGVCNSGTLSWINNTSSCGTTATWSCIGSNGGTNSSCIYGNPSCPIPVNGSCGSSSGVCDSGNMTWINNTSTCGTTATWSCTGYNGGTSVNCSKANSACSSNGVCGSSKGTCSSGTLSWIDNTSSCGTTAMWTCSGTNGGSMATCGYNNGECPINGSCGGSRGTCNTGSMTWIDNTSSCGTTATWKCDGSFGGTTANCSQYNGACATVNGQCGSSNGGTFNGPPSSNLCNSGSPSNVDYSSLDKYTWNCVGIGGGITTSCNANKKIFSFSEVIPCGLPGGGTQYVKTLEVTNVNGWNCNISGTNPNGSFYSDSSFKFLSPNGTGDQVDLICYNSTNAYLTEPGINITSTSSINTKGYECY